MLYMQRARPLLARGKQRMSQYSYFLNPVFIGLTDMILRWILQVQPSRHGTFDTCSTWQDMANTTHCGRRRQGPTTYAHRGGY